MARALGSPSVGTPRGRLGSIVVRGDEVRFDLSDSPRRVGLDNRPLRLQLEINRLARKLWDDGDDEDRQAWNEWAENYQTQFDGFQPVKQSGHNLWLRWVTRMVRAGRTPTLFDPNVFVFGRGGVLLYVLPDAATNTAELWVGRNNTEAVLTFDQWTSFYWGRVEPLSRKRPERRFSLITDIDGSDWPFDTPLGPIVVDLPPFGRDRGWCWMKSQSWDELGWVADPFERIVRIVEPGPFVSWIYGSEAFEPAGSFIQYVPPLLSIFPGGDPAVGVREITVGKPPYETIGEVVDWVRLNTSHFPVRFSDRLNPDPASGLRPIRRVGTRLSNQPVPFIFDEV